MGGGLELVTMLWGCNQINQFQRRALERESVIDLLKRSGAATTLGVHSTRDI